MFFAGAVQLILVMALWLIELLSRVGLVPAPSFAVPGVWVHVFLMIYGLFPFFIFGFLLTVYPRWMDGPVVARTRYVPVFALLVSGMLVFYGGLFIARAVLVLAGAIFLGGWILAALVLFDVYRQAARRVGHATSISLALAAAAAGLTAYLHGLLTNSGMSFLVARTLGIWLFLVPVVFSVSHRMIPFFSHSALRNYTMVRPGWSLPMMGICVAGHAALEVASLAQWRFLFDLPFALLALHHTVSWNFRRSFEVRLLAMLHIAFLWLSVSMFLYSIQSVLLLLGPLHLPARVPLHALGVGFVTSMVIAMASRVTLGHSGQPLVADRLTWAVLLGFNVAALLRITAEWVGSMGPWLNVLAAVAWLTSALAWVSHYAPVYLRPRLDGRPG